MPIHPMTIRPIREAISNRLPISSRNFSASCEAKAIVLTGISAEEHIQRAISAGATGVVYRSLPR